MADIKTLPDFEDPRVQTAYEVLCSPDEPPEGEHWEGFSARRIVAALAEAHQAEVARLTRENEGLAKDGKQLRKLLRGMLSLWDSVCSSKGWDKDHAKQAADARAAIAGASGAQT